MNIPPLHYLNKIGAADVFRYDSGSKKIVEVLKHNRSKPGFTNRKQLIGSNLTFGKLLVGRPEQPILIWIFRLMEVYFNLTVNLRDYDRVVDIYDALDRGEIDLGMIVEPILNTTLNRIVILKMDQHLYLPMNHTHHSDTFFIDIFAHDLRYAIVSLVMLIILLNAILTRKHSPIRHLLFVYELLSGTRAYPNPT
uniref:Uncharacterized protein n=1 Tax=Anopheles maculatus TaxID=74869 RepID=A0A182SUT7_9DIPT